MLFRRVCVHVTPSCHMVSLMHRCAHLLAVILLLSGCGSDIQVVSKESDRIVIHADSASDLAQAKERAQEYCAHAGKQANLSRSENVDDEVIAYFDCK